MKTIAVAGGTGGVGSTIVDGLVEYGKHKVYVLSRTERPSHGGVNYLKVDYNDTDAIAEAFEKVGVNIVICAISVLSPATNQAQKNLIRAAERSTSTERFVISSFDVLQVKEDIELSPLARYVFEAIDELEKTKLAYTRIANGWFLDYYGMPVWKSHLEPWINILNMKSKWAVIPGDGSIQCSFITSQDMSKFVARLMDLPKWNTVSAITGNTLSYNELVEMAEKARVYVTKQNSCYYWRAPSGCMDRSIARREPRCCRNLYISFKLRLSPKPQFLRQVAVLGQLIPLCLR
ncbi:hypothetical protein AUP68_15759 [Ilyonectria robusta]